MYKDLTKCPICGEKATTTTTTTTTYEHCGSAYFKCHDILVDSKDLCSDCGSYTYDNNRPETDLSDPTMCCYSHKVIANQFLDHEDFVLNDPDYQSCEKMKKMHEEFFNKLVRR